MAYLKNCLHCKKEFTIFESNDKWTKALTPTCYRHRKYCSNECKQAAYRARALQRHNRNAEIQRQGGVMPHLEEWAKKHKLI